MPAPHVIYVLVGLVALGVGIAGMARAQFRAAARADQLMREADENRRRAFMRRGM